MHKSKLISCFLSLLLACEPSKGKELGDTGVYITGETHVDIVFPEAGPEAAKVTTLLPLEYLTNLGYVDVVATPSAALFQEDQLTEGGIGLTDSLNGTTYSYTGGLTNDRTFIVDEGVLSVYAYLSGRGTWSEMVEGGDGTTSWTIDYSLELAEGLHTTTITTHHSYTK